MSEQTYRNPLFGQRVDRYIPPELRQGLGAVLALGDMLNPVSAYREYLKAVNEEDYTDAAVEAAGILAPGIAGKFIKPAVRAAGPYVDDATKAMMEVFLPTGAPDVAPRMVGGVEDFGRGLGSVRMPAAEASQGRAIIRPDDLFRGEGVPRITVRQTNQPFVARGTEQDQIDDMIQSGLVRPKVGGYGKEKKSDLYFGESPAALPTDIRQRPSESRFVLVGDSEKLAGTEGPIPIDQLRHVWVVRNGDTVDVLPEILRANRAFGGAQYRPD